MGVVTQVPCSQAEQRIVQTGVEYERAIPRDKVGLGTGQPQFAGHYNASVVGAHHGAGAVISGDERYYNASVVGTQHGTGAVISGDERYARVVGTGIGTGAMGHSGMATSPYMYQR